MDSEDYLQLYFILCAPHELRKKLFFHTDYDLIANYCTLVLNCLNGNLELSKQDSDLLNKYKRECKQIVRPVQHKKAKAKLIMSLDPKIHNLFLSILERHV